MITENITGIFESRNFVSGIDNPQTLNGVSPVELPQSPRNEAADINISVLKSVVIGETGTEHGMGGLISPKSECISPTKEPNINSGATVK